MKKPKGKEKSRIEWLIDKRDIKYLTHFTRIENLPSILQKGLMPRKQLLLQGIRPEVNDWNRLDNTDAVCLSVSFPNYKLFYRFRVKRPETKWAVILLDPIILDRCRCSFACRNAASNEMKDSSPQYVTCYRILHCKRSQQRTSFVTTPNKDRNTEAFLIKDQIFYIGDSYG